MNWRPISKRTWELCRTLADQRQTQKQHFSSGLYWNKDSHFIGLLGEALVSAELGMPLDTVLRVTGDNGTDFPGIDVKTSLFVDDPHLKVPTYQAQRLGLMYVLVCVDLPGRRAKIVGHATSEMILAAPQHNYGNGPMHYLTEAQLLPGIPPIEASTLSA